MGVWRRMATGIAAAALLSGCLGVPPALVAARYAAEAGAYATTGRTLTDHAISGVAGEDCRLWRVVDGADICQEWGRDGELQVARRTADPPVPAGAASAGGDGAVASTDPLAAYVRPADPVAPTSAADAQIAAADEMLFARPGTPVGAVLPPVSVRLEWAEGNPGLSPSPGPVADRVQMVQRADHPWPLPDRRPAPPNP